ncbi:MAG: UDP-N-acetylmuramoyl-L-alanine--D-glutamate ligase, partial [Candidatus Kerfeldbacteria bacterium]|nr:UDP-N-acetylmuramoyl-L-alanine--D-glutamate ligase [Candidatus Kerfeldbacteria bacterium]
MSSSAASDFFYQRRVLVVGLGLHGGGEAAVRWLCRHGAIVRVTDKKTKAELATTLRKLRGLPITWRLGRHDRRDFAWAECIVQNPGVPDTLPELLWARRHQIPIENEASIFFARCPGPIMGVTGTRGKTTTTMLIGAMLRAAKRRAVVSGNVRQVAMLDYLDRLTAKTPVVLELSSFQLERLPVVQRSPHVAVLTNLYVDHLNRYGTMTRYAAAKYNLVRFQQPTDIAILNAESAWCRAAAKLTSATIWWFQTAGRRGQQGITIDRDWIVAYTTRRAQRVMPISTIMVAGRHQRENVLAATAAALASGVPAANIRIAVRSFSGVPYRQELIRHWRGHDFINDTTATTPDGTLAAMEVFPKGFFILGGTDKQLDYRPLARYLHRHQIPFVLLPGTGTAKLINALRRAGDRRVRRPVLSMEAAVRQATSQAKPGQPIVLSPGAA